ncbi:hypothetical protein [Dyadobacter luticola]|uniref:Uncharacterized protein n=1 Tax=Dyadobacter luticola TaxID=1979387 RepID=A0A5R9KXL7_9BACT|nr:hypothetical protein [Dyadobacter luticola]TLV00817.1 hypothetical protein FEN17_15170 [Dyadobacter luticola]
MTKSTFVLFFSLVQFLAFNLFPQQAAASCHFKSGKIVKSGKVKFSPRFIETAQFELVCTDDTLYEDETIVRADDEFEWKENLSSLLRHRQSTYRFLTSISPAVTHYSITQIPKIDRESVSLPVISKGSIIRPGYYGFLHRLCPF